MTTGVIPFYFHTNNSENNLLDIRDKKKKKARKKNVNTILMRVTGNFKRMHTRVPIVIGPRRYTNVRKYRILRSVYYFQNESCEILTIAKRRVSPGINEKFRATHDTFVTFNVYNARE